MREKILVVEDEKPIADTITYALSTDGFEPSWCSTGTEALHQLERNGIALVILDVGLPDMDGFALAREIRKTGDLPIIFLTARSSEVDRVVGLELGADDYVSKPFSPRELSARVKAVLRRSAAHRTAASPTPSSSRVFQIDEDRYRISFKEQLLDLSKYEFKLLKVLIDSPGRVFTREHLMALCWEEPEMSLERTVDAHIKNIRAKLRAVDPDLEVIITQRGIGYSLREGL